jgi:hypothetical protein
VNDLSSYISNGITTQFADDTSSIVTGGSLQAVEGEAIKAPYQLKAWSENNKLTLNPSQTTYLYFKPSKSLSLITPDFKTDDETITQSSNTTFLGLQLDGNLARREHILYITPKISKNIFLLRKLSFELSIKELIKV